MRKSIYPLLVLVLVFCLIGCAGLPIKQATTTPDKKDVKIKKEKKPAVPLISKKVSLKIYSIPESATVFVNEKKLGKTPLKISFNSNKLYKLVLKKENYADKCRFVKIKKDAKIKLLLDKKGSFHDHIITLKTGSMPKQVCFTPDNKLLFATLLGDIEGGVDVIGIKQLSKKQRISFGKANKKSGFAEVVFNKSGKTAWVSQMTTDLIYRIDVAKKIVLYRISTKGTWSKIIALHPDEKIAYVSNWVSNNISVVDLKKKETIKLIKTGKTPRGIAFTPNGKFAYVVHFNDNQVVKIDAEKHKVVKRIKKKGTHIRHIVIDKEGKKAYISDLTGKVKIHILDLTNDSYTKTIRVYSKPNTIELTPDGKYLYVSCRGIWGKPYPRKKWKKGKIYIINTNTLKIEEKIPAGNDPTGLDISPDGKLLCFSNFRDDVLEFYRIINKNTLREEQFFPLHPAEILVKSFH